jgi:hypothetical protein
MATRGSTKVSLLLTYEQQNEIQSSTGRPATVGLLLRGHAVRLRMDVGYFQARGHAVVSAVEGWQPRISVRAVVRRPRRAVMGWVVCKGGKIFYEPGEDFDFGPYAFLESSRQQDA